MCGRAVQLAFKTLWRSRLKLMGVPPGFAPRYNISPTSTLLVLRATPDGIAPSLMRWGLVPDWWKDATKLPTSTFNARAETLAKKPTFRTAFKRRRCIIPLSGFYEWAPIEGKAKQPFFIHPKDPDTSFAVAGLWESWETQDGAIESCTIITTEPNALMSKIHSRMPVILHDPAIEEWMDPANEDTVSLQRLLLPCNPEGMESYPVGPVRGDGPDLIEPIY